jgi:hypothetical protein
VAIGAAQAHEVGPRLSRQSIVALILVDVRLGDPAVQGGLGDFREGAWRTAAPISDNA